MEVVKEFCKYFDPLLLEMVYKNFYVDDCLVSVANVKQAANMRQNLCVVLQKEGFKLKEWMSINEAVLGLIPEEDKSTITQNAIGYLYSFELVC